ncbi:MAG: class I SAM-dependent methyltransferase [Polyangia bacterium]
MSLTRADYDAWAATYDVVDNPLVAMSTFALDEAARGWSGARVLELGCGTARNAPTILAAGAREYVGLDASPEMLDRGRQRSNDPRIRLLTGDVTAAPRESFDAAFFCLVLEHFEQLDAPLAAAASTLRRDGELAIFELHPAWWHDGARAHYVVDGTERALASWPHDEPEFATALPAHSLELVTCRTWYAHEAACALSPKLRKRLGRPILLELRARREP